ncbi:hypothetical protein ACFYRN_39280 [Streptomyces sp. NPDC005227]|uniref:hypothetical protein n=1 Tax=unclassified Streptomyces TaxID=2593676 RepID=UPI0036964968
MTEAATPTRKVLKGIEASGAHPVEYRFAHARSGNRHLMVVFSNIYAPDDYGWGTGVLDGLRSNILWIRDRFVEKNTYYLCREMDFSVEASVITLITSVTKALGLTPGDVTLWGSSKGGSAALYYGLKYGFRNIVASVPQLRIGSFVRETYPEVGRHMLGEAMSDDSVAVLDALLPDLLASGANPEAHIYMVSSPQDEQYPTQVEPYLGLLQAYPNFNLIFSESPFITGHGKVTQRNTPPLLGIGYLLVEGIAPRLGVTRHGYEQPDADRSAIDTYLASTSVLRGAEFPAPTVSAPAAHAQLPCDQVRFSGQALGAVRVSVWEQGKFIGQAPVAQDGSWSWELGRTWNQGAHTLKIFSADASGFQSERTEVAFTALDAGAAGVGGFVGGTPSGGVAQELAAGAAAVHTPAAYEQVMDARVVFTGVAVGAVGVGFHEGGRLLGNAAVGQDGTWAWETGWEWAPGSYTVEAVALDAFGGQSPIAQTPFTVLGAMSQVTSEGGYYGGEY